MVPRPEASPHVSPSSSEPTGSSCATPRTVMAIGSPSGSRYPLDADRDELVVGRPERIRARKCVVADRRQVGHLDQAQRRAAVPCDGVAIVAGLWRLDDAVRAQGPCRGDEWSSECQDEDRPAQHAPLSECRASGVQVGVPTHLLPLRCGAARSSSGRKSTFAHVRLVPDARQGIGLSLASHFVAARPVRFSVSFPNWGTTSNSVPLVMSGSGRTM